MNPPLQPPDSRARKYVKALYYAGLKKIPPPALNNYGLSKQDHPKLVIELNRIYQQALAGLRPIEEVSATLHLYIETFAQQLATQQKILVFDMLGSSLCIQRDLADGLDWLGSAKELCDASPHPDLIVSANVEQHYGNALLNTGNVTAALEALQRGAIIASSLGGAIYVQALLNLSVAYKASRDHIQRRRALESAARAAKEAGLNAYYVECQSQLQGIP